jgi:hypothetical protein
MHIEVVGAITVVLGLIGCFVGQRFAVSAFCVSMLLSAAAAVILTSLGGASIPPAYLLLGFLALSGAMSRGSRRRAGEALMPPNAGFWLLLTAVYALLSAFFLPRIFADETYVYTITRTEIGMGLIAMPLTPSSGNITQLVYFLGDVLCFLVFYDAASRPNGLKTIVDAVIISTAINLGFAVIDLVTFWTGLGDILGVIRNGNYRMLDDGTVLGFHRIVGSFPEASSFAYYTVGFFAFCTKLSLDGVRPRITGFLALSSLVALILATSSTGYVATSGFLAVLFVVSLPQIFFRPVRKSTFVMVTIFPLLVSAGLVGLRLDGPLWLTATEIVDTSIFNKMSSQSGVERAKWNDQALINFVDTSGLGAGTGSVRASSFPIAVLSNIGVFGAFTYSVFLLSLFFSRKGKWQHPFPASCQSAARWACLAQLIGASVAGSFIDLGLLFFIFAGLACAGPETVPVARRSALLPVAAPTTSSGGQ